MGESGAVPGVPPRDGEVSDVSASAPDAPADEAADEALDDALRELFAESRTEDRRKPPVVLMPWYRGVSGLL